MDFQRRIEKSSRLREPEESDKLSAIPGTTDGMPPRQLRRFGAMSGANGRSKLYPLAIVLCAILLGFAATKLAAAAIVAGAGAGALFVLRGQVLALVGGLVMLALIGTVSAAWSSPGCWSLMVLMIVAGAAPARLLPFPRYLPDAVWVLCMVLGAACICATAAISGMPAVFALVLGSLCAAVIGAGLAQHLGIFEAGVIRGSQAEIRAMTRDLLLGRVTGGMLHDLSQPLNVIAMANGNLGYILEQLDIDPDSRQQMHDRIDRITVHTEGAADILALFRGLGLEGSQGAGPPSVRSALGRALAATRSNVRHHVNVEMQGDALDRLVPGRHDTLEMMGVAALLSAFGAFVDASGQKLKGKVVLSATASPAHVMIQVQCWDEGGSPIDCAVLDDGMRWLVEQVAREAGGDLHCLPRFDHRPAHLVIHLARSDV